MYKKITEKEKGLAVETVCLTKMYKDKAAVKQLNMSVREGEIYGFIGKNGAGKSTTMKMLCGLAGPTSGEIRLFGKPVSDPVIRRRMGVLIETPGLYPHMTARQNAVLKARCLGLADERSVDEALTLSGLSDAGTKKVKCFSMGMKQRLSIALALVGKPDLLILDEPINGLDPKNIAQLRSLLKKLNEEHKVTMLISSHILSEIDQMATHVGIIDKGQLIFQDRLSALHEHSRSRLRLRTTDNAQALDALRQKGIPAAEQDGQLILKDSSDDNVSRAIRLLVYANVGILRAEEAQMSLEDIFLNLTGRKVSL